MPREFVSRRAMADALAGDLEAAVGYSEDLPPLREIADHLIEAGWRPGGDDA